MQSKRDRFGPVQYLTVAALLVCSLFIGAPGAHAGELDTGPAFELVTFPAELVPLLELSTVTQPMELYVYFAANELRAEISTLLASPVEVARYESGHRSGVGKRSLTITGYDVDLTRIARGRGLASPLRI